jgi:hypothetical protein
MVKKEEPDINELLLEAHKRGIELAIDTSIRTGVPLVVEKDGKIIEIKPKFKYVRVPIDSENHTNGSSLP